jgi:hypothetical protein
MEPKTIVEIASGVLGFVAGVFGAGWYLRSLFANLEKKLPPLEQKAQTTAENVKTLAEHTRSDFRDLSRTNSETFDLSPAKTPSAPLNLSPFPVVTKNVTSRICDPGEAHANFRDPVPRQNSIRAFESLTVPGGDKKCHLPHMGSWRGAREFSGPCPSPKSHPSSWSEIAGRENAPLVDAVSR